MIEIEKNFDLKPGDKERLIAGAKFLKKKTFTDVYYVNDAYDLTCKDFWLRTRDGRFELKVPLNDAHIGDRKTDRYRELETDAEITRELGFAIKTNFTDALAEAKYKPFATITTTRETYEKGDFHLDFDEMDFGFVTFEAELMVGGESEIADAERRILKFAKEHGIAGNEGHGKVIEYIARNRPAHYAALVARGVIYPHTYA